MNIAILGGSFDPPHNSHLKMIQTAMKCINSQKAFLLPAGSHAFKGPNITNKTHRLNMAVIAAKSINDCDVCDLEINREGVSYSVDTLRILNDQLPNNKFYFVIGSDVLLQLHLWKNIQELSSLTRFICFIRKGHNNLDIQAAGEKLSANFGSHISIFSEWQIEGISSTDIRGNILGHKDDLPIGVWGYIQENGLYSLTNNYDLEH